MPRDGRTLHPIIDAIYDATLRAAPMSTCMNEADLSKLGAARGAYIGYQSMRMDQAKTARGSVPEEVMATGQAEYQAAAKRRSEPASRPVGKEGKQ